MTSESSRVDPFPLGPMGGEFDEAEDPLSPGTPIYHEMPEHFEEAWLIYAKRAVQRITQFGIDLLGLRDVSTSVPGPADEWFEDEEPARGFPDLCSEYDLPPLPQLPDEHR